jgi:hypothetical protein
MEVFFAEKSFSSALFWQAARVTITQKINTKYFIKAEAILLQNNLHFGIV